MRSGIVWEPVCGHCGKLTCLDARWQEEQPDDVAPNPGTCCDSPRPARWERAVVRAVGYMRLSGFSTSESDFTPHWNEAFGKPVHSLAEMRHLQESSGMSDAVVKGNGADRHAPRDITRRIKHHDDFSEKVAAGKPIDMGRGVRVEFTEPGD